MRRLFCLLMLASAASAAIGAPLDAPECIAPAKPGGAFELTCKLGQTALMRTGILKAPLRISFLPGGIGAVAYVKMITQRSAEPNVMVAFSGGSLLNIAQGKFGKYSEQDVRWLAVVGADYGAVIVRKESPFKSLQDLTNALRADPGKVVIGAGGTIGTQDWMKAALTARAAGANYKAMRFVAFEGGGDTLAALRGGHVDAYFGDASEAEAQIREGANIRVLAVMSDKRLPGALADVPTAREQGIAIEWPIVRGFYMGPKVSEADFRVWTEAFEKMGKTAEFTHLLKAQGLYPFFLTGPALDAYIRRTTDDYRRLAAEFGLSARAK